MCNADPESGQTLISGMGELHLEIIVDRLTREFNIQANVGKPQVTYKETITKAVDSEYRYERQIGGKDQFGHVVIHMEPGGPGSGFVFKNELKGGEIPDEFIKDVEAGLSDAMQAGVIAGYKMDDVTVTLTGGSYDEATSIGMALPDRRQHRPEGGSAEGGADPHGAGHEARGRVPGRVHGDVINDINSRRGRIENINMRGASEGH